MLNKKNREFLIFLFFFFVASVFWLIQTLDDEYETELSIPLRLKNVPNDVVLTLAPPQEVRITLKDKGTVLMNYMFGQSFYPIILNFEDYDKSGNHIRLLPHSLQKIVSSQLLSSSKVSAVKPDTLDIIYIRGDKKRIPVQLTGKYSAEQQHYISKITYQPDSVDVYAPDEILDTIQYAYTEMVALKNLTDTATARIRIKEIKGAKFVPHFIDAKFYIDIYTDKTVEVPIKGVGFPADKSLKTFPSKVNVTFQVGLNKFKSITPDLFSIEIPYNELKDSKTDKYTLRLKETPKHVNHIRISPKEVEFLIEQKIIDGE